MRRGYDKKRLISGLRVKEYRVGTSMLQTN